MKHPIQKILPALKKYVFQNHAQWKYWVVLAIIFKTLIFALHLSQAEPAKEVGFIGYDSGDSQSYLDPVENLINHGVYSPDYRMPGYAVAYVPLRLVFEKAMACNAMLIIQLLMASLAVYCLALTARHAFQSDTMFYLVFYVYLISSYANLFDAFLLTESLCTSVTIFSIYFFSRFTEKRLSKYLMISGLFLTWAIFLRPVYAPLLLLFCGALLVEGLLIRISIKAALRTVLIFVIPFTILESCWITRNYVAHKRFIPLTQSFYYPGTEVTYIIELMNFVKSWGGDRTWWNPKAEIRWFGLTERQQGRSRPLENGNVSLPEYIFTSKFSSDSLVAIKKNIQTIDADGTPDSVCVALTSLVKKKLVNYTTSLKEEKPFIYYVKAPLLLVKKFFIHSGTYNLFNKPFQELSPIALLTKVFYSILYLVTILGGMVGIVWAVRRRWTSPITLLLTGATLYSVLFFPVVLRQIEFRYFVPAYPLMTVMACYFFLQVARFVRSLYFKPIEGR